MWILHHWAEEFCCLVVYRKYIEPYHCWRPHIKLAMAEGKVGAIFWIDETMFAGEAQFLMAYPFFVECFDVIVVWNVCWFGISSLGRLETVRKDTCAWGWNIYLCLFCFLLFMSLLLLQFFISLWFLMLVLFVFLFTRHKNEIRLLDSQFALVCGCLWEIIVDIYTVQNILKVFVFWDNNSCGCLNCLFEMLGCFLHLYLLMVVQDFLQSVHHLQSLQSPIDNRLLVM